MEIVGLIIGVGVLTTVVVGMLARARYRDRLAVWRRIAASRGGEFHEPGAPGRPTLKHAVEVDVGDARVYMDTHVVHTGRSGDNHTRIRARSVVPGGPKLRVCRESTMSTLSKAFGMDDVVLGDHPTFDDLFQVKASDAEAVRALWSASARELMATHAQEGLVTSDGTVIELSLPGHVTSREAINGALDLVGELAAADLFGLAALRSLPDAAYIPPAGPWDNRSGPRVEVRTPAQVTLAPVVLEDRKRPVTTATAEGVAAEQALTATIDADGEIECEGELSSDLASTLRRCSSGSLTVDDGRARFCWPGIETDRARLQAGIELVAAFLSDRPGGAYR